MVDEDDPRLGEPVIGIGPHVEIPERPFRVGTGRLEPWVRIAGVIHHQVGDHAHAPFMRAVDQLHKVPDIAEIRQNGCEIRDVVPAVAQR